ncbi:MAG: UDP-N-acetylmuramoyl-L-alanine--D-glutamate ligase [Firmicutes bacterium]|nr:UDP-N-acetylmuramoyl-L-alanine--D-glutamate ligase [Bacillota bacterium]
MNFKNKRVLIIGMGTSGKSANIFLKKRGAIVTLYDDKEYPISHETISIDDFDLAVLSPGVSISHPLAQKFRYKITSELALGFCVPHKKKVGVTGTNGKTSVVNMINNAINANSKKPRGILVGNSGVPVTSKSKEIRQQIPVTEVSSFMLETQICQDYISTKRWYKRVIKFRPKIAVILNISQDHLDRHGTMENYINHKAAISKHQKRCDKLILNFDNENTRNIKSRAKILYFSTKSRVNGIYIEDGNVMLNLRYKAKRLFKLSDIGMHKQHDIENFLVTTLVCHLLKIPKKNLLNLKMLEKHRIQHVANIGQISFYNDSKGTNIGATLAACNSFKLPINLLVGGMDKGQTFETLFENLPSNVTKVFIYGSCKEKIKKAADDIGFDKVELCDDMYDATKKASYGDGPRVVLLSPACASFDEFQSYEDRGYKFIEFIKSINEDSGEANA